VIDDGIMALRSFDLAGNYILMEFLGYRFRMSGKSMGKLIAALGDEHSSS
jgi:hypothetical protein